MGRGGLYYRASLNSRPAGRKVSPPSEPAGSPSTSMHEIERGDILEMTASSGSNLLAQINEKASSLRSWPWVLGTTICFTLWLSSVPSVGASASVALVLGILATLMAAYWDQQRRTIVVMYDLSEDILKSYEAFANAIERVGTAQRIWNIDAAGYTDDWKRNAGAGRLVERKSAKIEFSCPSIIKTNVSVPAIIGGRQSLYFFPDVVLVCEGNRFGSIAHSDMEILWSDSHFLEADAVPRDAEVIGYSWQYVNRNGGPDRRFKNNREIPRVRYQQLGLSSPSGLRKIVQLSKNSDRSEVNASYDRHVTAISKLIASPTNMSVSNELVRLPSSSQGSETSSPGRKKAIALVAGAVGIIAFPLLLGHLMDRPSPPAPKTSGLSSVVAPKVEPSFDCSKVHSDVLKLICNTPSLALADRQLADVYAHARATDPNPVALRAEQRSWIRKRNNSKADVFVLERLYERRLASLKSPRSRRVTNAETTTGGGASLPAVPENQPTDYYYIVGLDPNGDQWLYLWSEPSEDTGIRIRPLRPEILLSVLETRDGWSRVKTMTGDEGWVHSTNIQCCRKA